MDGMGGSHVQWSKLEEEGHVPDNDTCLVSRTAKQGNEQCWRMKTPWFLQTLEFQAVGQKGEGRKEARLEQHRYGGCRILGILILVKVQYLCMSKPLILYYSYTILALLPKYHKDKEFIAGNKCRPLAPNFDPEEGKLFPNLLQNCPRRPQVWSCHVCSQRALSTRVRRRRKQGQRT